MIESDKLKRYGIEWKGPTQPMHSIMPDGYWTPWHIANETILALIARIEAAEAELEQEKRRLDWALEKTSTYAGNLFLWHVDGKSKALNTDNPRATIDELMGE